MEILGYTLLDLAVLLVIAAIGGGLVQALAGYSPGGCLISLIFGFLGAGLASWLVVQFGWPTLFSIPFSGESYEIVWPLIGAILFALILGFLTQRLIVDL